MQRIRTILIGTLLLTLIATVVSFFVPVPNSWPLSDLEFYLPFAANAIMACFYIGAAVLFMTNLDVYKTKLRQAYTGIALSSVIIGLGMLQISIIGALDAWRSAYVLGGGMMLPFLVATIMMYLSIRRLSLLTRTEHLFAHAWLALPVATAAAFGSTLLPHVPVTLTESNFDKGIAVIMFSATLLALCAIIVRAVGKQSGAIYTRPLTWLVAALLVSGITLAIQCVYYLITTDYDHIVTRINNIVGIVSGIIWLRAAYAFALTKYYSEDVPLLTLAFGQSDPSANTKFSNPVDMVTYAAGLASNSSDIDPMLDKLRAVTVKLRPGETPSGADTKTLVQTYLEIEHYLLTKEAVRNFSRDEIRRQIDPKLRALFAQYER